MLGVRGQRCIPASSLIGRRMSAILALDRLMRWDFSFLFFFLFLFLKTCLMSFSLLFRDKPHVQAQSGPHARNSRSSVLIRFRSCCLLLLLFLEIKRTEPSPRTQPGRRAPRWWTERTQTVLETYFKHWNGLGCACCGLVASMLTLSCFPMGKPLASGS